MEKGGRLHDSMKSQTHFLIVLLLHLPMIICDNSADLLGLQSFNTKDGNLEKNPILHLELKMYVMEHSIRQNQVELRSMQKSMEKLTKLVQDNLRSTKAQVRGLSSRMSTISTRVVEHGKLLDNIHQHQQHIAKKIKDQTRKIQSFHPFTQLPKHHSSSSSSSSSNMISLVYYPPGRSKNFVLSYYPEYRARFVGFGQSTQRKGYKRKDEISFYEGLEWCYLLRTYESSEYNGFEYTWTGRYGYCLKGRSDHDAGYQQFLHFQFET